MTRPFRFGVIAGGARSRAEWVAKARKAEELGYATLLVPDHIAVGIAPLTALAVAAEATTSLRVGSFVCDNDFRHPALLAKEAATLDLLSDGRFELGMGAGYLPDDYTQLGIPFESAGIRVGRLEEALQIVRRLFSEETLSFSGKHYHIAEMQGVPKPVQKPHLPIFLGGRGKRVLSLAARFADSIGFGFAAWDSEATEGTPEDIAQRISWVREAAGERFEQLELGYTIYQLLDMDEKPRGVSSQSTSVSPSFHALSGNSDKMIEEIQARRERYGFSYVQVSERHMEAFAPVVARLAGR
jgi:probable F420-dependent oxidoreductase